jgi:protein gp37
MNANATKPTPSWRDVLPIHPAAELFPLMSPAELRALGEDIKQHGLRSPIALWRADPKGEALLLDGRNRLDAIEIVTGSEVIVGAPSITAGEDFLACDKVIVLDKSTDPFRYVISANINRRHLTAEQKRDLIAKLIEATPEKSNRQIAETVKASHHTVGAVRTKMEGRGQVAHVETRTDSKGRKQPAKKPGTTVATIIIDHRKAHEQPVGSSGKTTIVRNHLGQEVEYSLPKAKPKFNFTNEQVSWACWTWNPVTGCLHNCPYCYAREGAVMNENLRQFYPFGFEPTLYDYRMGAPGNTKVPEGVRDDPRLGRVFVTSMGDLFGKWVPDEWIQKVFASCRANPQWEYLFLTKFPQRYVGLQLPPTAWLGTTVDEQYRVKIAEEAFRKIEGVRVKWLSLEPLLSPLEFTDLSMFDWVVLGAQSATKQPHGRVPEFAPKWEWVSRLTDQACAAGCRVYQKPNLLGVPNPQCPGMQLIHQEPILPQLPRAQGEFWQAQAADSPGMTLPQEEPRRLAVPADDGLDIPACPRRAAP